MHGGSGVDVSACERPSLFMGPDGGRLSSCGRSDPFWVVEGSHHLWEAAVSISRGW